VVGLEKAVDVTGNDEPGRNSNVLFLDVSGQLKGRPEKAIDTAAGSRAPSQKAGAILLTHSFN
jgi:hypothetical protein